MKKTKVIALVLVAIMCVSVLAACGQSAAPAASAKKVVTTATNVAFPPYEYYENEKAVGIDVDIVKAVCDKLGYEMEINDMEFGSVITSVAAGKVDVGFGAITITEERAKSVDFTTSYATGIQTVIVTEGSSIKSVDDLANAGKIGVQADTTGDIYATGDFGEEHIARFNKGADAVQALLTGKCDAVIIDDSPAKTFYEQNDGLVLLDTAYAEEAYGFEISKDNKDFYNEFNTALEALIADGTVQAIIDKYITAD